MRCGRPPPAEKNASAFQPSPEIPDEFLKRAWGLADVLDLGLRNNPSTRAAWADARGAAAAYGIQRAAYLPKVNLEATGGFKSTKDSRNDGSWEQNTLAPGVNLSWMLLDFGIRTAALESAVQTLAAANWNQNAVLHDTVLAVEKAYFSYLAAKATLEAKGASLREAESQVEAAMRRHEAGVATLADVLQARTAAAQAKLAFQSADGAVQTVRGALAASMGLPANLAFDIAGLPRDIPLVAVQRNVDELIGEALLRRPSLSAARAAALAAEAQVRQAQADGLPTLSLSASGTGTRFYVTGDAPSGTSAHREDVYSAAVLLRFPLFTGFSQTFNVQKTRAQADSAAERVKGLEQQVMFQVFSAYSGLKTATEKVQTVESLLASALQSEQMARGRYDEGVGTILEVLSAQSALADARSQDIQSRWEWYTNLAQLAHDTGLLGLQGETPLAPRGAGTPAPSN